MPLKENTQYKWNPDSTFTMTAEQFSIMFNAISSVVANPSFSEMLKDAQRKAAEAQQTFVLYDCQNVMNKILESAVEQGIAVEQEAVQAQNEQSE